MSEPILISGINFLKRFTDNFSSLGEDYACIHIQPGSRIDIDRLPSVRFSGVMMILVCKGCVNMSLNMEEFHLKEHSFIAVVPGDVIDVHDLGDSDFEAYVMYMSVGFLHDINFEINMLNMVPIEVKHAHYMTLGDREYSLLTKYMDLIYVNLDANNAPSNEIYARSILRNLFSSMLYQMLAFFQSHRLKEQDGERQRSRKMIYTHEFMHLVQKNFRRERSVGFYADKLCISPKYLSLVIKESTGRSAAMWIDDFVLMEAKNLLRFSGKNIQQVAYELNFTNQSSFGKYFKHLTGMSPSEFQHS